MVIFKYEMKNYRKYILVWAAALAVCIFSMTPVYYSMMNSAGAGGNALFETLGSSDFFQTVGMSMDYLTTPLGIYSFLTSFFALAAGIFGMHFGISIHTREFSGKTSEYLYTKPHTRGEIFRAKAWTVFCGTLIVGLAYLLSSLLTLLLFQPGFDWWEFFLISLSLFFVALIFAAMGLLAGVWFSNNRNPLLTAGLAIFTEYCITSFSRVVGNRAIGFLSPFSFFGAAEISRNHFYEMSYVVWYFVLLAVCLLAAYRIFLKKDIPFRS
ncbi:MAG: ABC transporter permease subunit [Lachnospiraceae bacterium]|nr:ABC transporter permease subunit [Lachnospiraceae bacterium]